MSLRPQPVPLAPDETVRVARTAFLVATSLMLRDELGTFAADEDFAAPFPTHGRPAAAPWRLALVTTDRKCGGMTAS